jgi:hypothetical protein
MTARIAAAAVSLGTVIVLSGCTSFYEIPIETPIQPKMDVSPFQRVLIAGFVSGGSDDVDTNLETVRLLRSQLRTKSSLRVIEADVLPLVEMARDQQPAGTNGEAAEPPQAGTNPPAERTNPPAEHGAAPIREEKDLEPYETLFANGRRSARSIRTP